MGNVLTAVQDLGDSIFESVKMEKLLLEADLPFDVTLVHADADSINYTFTTNDMEYGLVWSENVLVLRQLKDTNDYPQPVYSPEVEGMDAAANLRENVLEYVGTVENWQRIEEIPFVKAHPGVFSMSYSPTGVIIEDSDFRAELNFDGDDFAVYVRVLDASMIEDGETFDSPADVPLFYTDPFMVHPAMGMPFLHYICHEVGLDSEQELIESFKAILSPSA